MNKKFDALFMLSELHHILSKAFIQLPSEDEYIADGFDEEVDRLKQLAKGGKELLAKMCEQEKQKTGIQSLKIKYNGMFGYFFEIPASQSSKIPDYFIRKQTLSTGERYITQELKQFEEQIISAQHLLEMRQQEIWEGIQSKIIHEISSLQKLSSLIAKSDVLQSFANAAKKNTLVRPKISRHSRAISIKAGRHLVVEDSLKKQKKRFIPNTLAMEESESFHIITGPNMAGKSTFLRQNAIIIFLAHIGCMVPADEASIPIIDSLFTRIGSGDSLSTGESTFLVEMQEAARILRTSTNRSFIILDEIGRGTSTYDGLSIAWAITEFLHEKGSKTLFATHYHELISLADRLPNAKNFSAQVLENKEQGVIFLHQIFEGGAEKSFGIEVGKLAGLPHSVIKKAESVLKTLENNETTSKKNKQQVSLFDEVMVSSPDILPKKSPVDKAIEDIDPAHITPMQALEILYRLKKINNNS